MTIATQGGKIIVKDGKLAEDCGCCGGWYCYAPDCPCRYAKTLPNTLNMAVTVSVPSDIYAVFLTNFTASYVAAMRFTPQQLAASNGTYTLSKVSGSQCNYQFNSPWYGMETSSAPSAAIYIGDQAGLFDVSQGQLCTASQASVRLMQFGFTASGNVSTSVGQINNFSTLCAGIATALNSAATRTYGSTTYSARFNSLSTQGYIGNRGCGIDYWLVNGGSFGGVAPVVAGEYDFPPCANGLLERIDHTWAFDLLYTDTSGSSPTRASVPRAVTVRVFE